MFDTTVRLSKPLDIPFTTMRASALLKANIEALLKLQHKSKADLEKWCRKKGGWLSHALNEPARGLPVKHLDRIADFFGKDTYELFRYGPVSERRSGKDRRAGGERRKSPDERLMMEVAGRVADARPHNQPKTAIETLILRGVRENTHNPDAIAAACRILGIAPPKPPRKKGLPRQDKSAQIDKHL